MAGGLPRKIKKKKTNEGFSCPYCGASYKREKTLIAHMCEKKRRYNDKDTKHVRMAFYIYERFMKVCIKTRKKIQYKDFVESSFYLDFVKFARYLNDLHAVNPKAFVDFLLTNGIELKKWQSDSIYSIYVRELAKKETPDAAVERNILLMEQWAIDTEYHWTEFFEKIKTPLATSWIKSGRISPWVLYTANSAKKLLERMSDEQLLIVEKSLDTNFWGEKLKRNTDEVSRIKEILDEAGL